MFLWFVSFESQFFTIHTNGIYGIDFDKNGRAENIKTRSPPELTYKIEVGHTLVKINNSLFDLKTLEVIPA